MDIETKKTALEDEAGIYQKRKSSYSKEDIKTLTLKEKLIYFRDYYLLKTILVVGVLVAAVVLIYDIFLTPSKTIYNVVFTDTCRIEKTDVMSKNLEEFILPEDDPNLVNVSSYDLDNYQVSMSFSTQLLAGAIDSIVCSHDSFVSFSQSGYYVDLEDYLPDETLALVKDRLLYASTVDLDNDGTIIKEYEPRAYGIDISDCKAFRELNSTAEQVVIGVTNNEKNKEYIIKAIEYFATH